MALRVRGAAAVVRAARSAPIVVATLLAAGSGQAFEPPSIAIYPVQREADGGDAAADVQALLQSALDTVARSGAAVQATPAIAPRRCGAARTAAVPCLAGLADGGLVVRATARAGGGSIVAMVEAVDARGQVFGPLRVTVDEFLQSTVPFARALVQLAESSRAATALIGGAPAEPARPQPATASAATAAIRSTPRVILPPAPNPAPRAPGAWRRTLGIVATVAGVACVSGGAVVASVNSRLASDLDLKYGAGRLEASDRAAYDRVELYNRISLGLQVGGGVIAAVGLTTWALAPSVAPAPGGGLQVGVTGRF